MNPAAISSAARVASLRTYPLRSKRTEAFSSSARPVSRRAHSTLSIHATWFGVVGGPAIGTRTAHGCRRIRSCWLQAQRDSASRQSSSGAIGGGGPTAASTISISSSSLAFT